MGEGYLRARKERSGWGELSEGDDDSALRFLPSSSTTQPGSECDDRTRRPLTLNAHRSDHNRAEYDRSLLLLPASPRGVDER